MVPDGDSVELGATLTTLQMRRLLGVAQESKLQVVLDAIVAFRTRVAVTEPTP